MPLRHSSLPHGPKMQLYRKHCRSAGWRISSCSMADNIAPQQPNDDKSSDINDAACNRPKTRCSANANSPGSKDSLAQSTTTWNVLAQQVMMAIVDIKEGPEQVFPMDDWSGYVARAEQADEVHRKIARSPTRSCSPATTIRIGSTICASTTCGRNADRRHGVRRHEHLERRQRRRAHE